MKIVTISPGARTWGEERQSTAFIALNPALATRIPKPRKSEQVKVKPGSFRSRRQPSRTARRRISIPARDRFAIESFGGSSVPFERARGWPSHSSRPR